ncbi:MAG: RNA polymerase sigma factor [Bacteroidetes bacterium]|nr:RNA polymerase sigma factor [Bacteroidota bacterium]
MAYNAVCHLNMNDKGNLVNEINKVFCKNRIKYLNYIMQRIKSDDAEDILHDVFANILVYIRNNNDEQKQIRIDNINSLIFVAIRNRIIDAYRKKTAILFSNLNVPAKEDDDIEEYANLLADMDFSPDILLSRKTIQEAIRSEVKKLPPEQRYVFERNEIDGLSFKDIADESGININTLLARKHYAVARLRSKLKGIYQILN